MKRASLALVLICVAASSRAQISMQFIDNVRATSISADGTVIAGNADDYEAFRWTYLTGVVRLGYNTWYTIGTAAGTPDISDDGTTISATILGVDSTYMTQGVWTEETGWIETMPPTLPDGGPQNGDQYGSMWGLSGDGKTAVGFYWATPPYFGKAHASAWTEATGLVNLGSPPGRSSRANAANFDGTIIVGWEERTDGVWRPVVWDHGVNTILTDTEAFCEATCVTPDGKIIGGSTYNAVTNQRAAALWHWNGSSWDEQELGVLPGTFPNYGEAIAQDMTPDGGIVVGFNAFDNSGNSSGFIWTQSGGMVDVVTFLTAAGVTIPSTFDVLTLSGISADGSVMIGVGRNKFFPYAPRSFVIYDGPTAVGDAPANFQIGQNYPNPFNPSTTIPVTLSRGDDIRVDVFGVDGRLIRRLHRGHLAAGTRELRWDGRDDGGAVAPSGVYFVRASDGTGASQSRRIVLLK